MTLDGRAPLPAPAAPAKFCGIQDGAGILPSFALYHLTAAIPGHPQGSTVSAQTLERAGYRLPSTPLPKKP